MAKVVFKNLTKKFEDVVAINDLNDTIEDKEFVVLVGPSGCGKTTTLRMIAGLEEVTEGEIYIDDRLVNKVAPKDRDIAMVFQNYALYPHFNVYNNMAFGLKLRRMPKDEINKRVTEAAKILKIEDLLKRMPKQLSGGQKQRVALGRAIVRNPKVFLMDEPLSNLDAKLRVQMRTEIVKLHERLNSTVIYVTHDQTEAMTMADKIILLKDGIVQQTGKPQEIYDNPNNMFVAGFIGSPAMNFIDVTVTKKMTLKSKVFELDSGDKIKKIIEKNDLVGKEIVLGIRPEDLEDSSFVQNTHKGNTIKAKIEVREPMGAEIYLYLDIEGVLITARVDPKSKYKSGETAILYVDIDKLYLFNRETEEVYE
jgi:multiple sugar transport system ATP-binding protein